MDWFFFMVVILIGLAAYFIPAIVAFKTSHPFARAILVLNLLLGWTFLGWVGALVWSLARPRPTPED